MRKYEQVAILMERGLSVEDIMREMGVSRSVVHSLCHYARHTEHRRRYNRAHDEKWRRKMGLLTKEERRQALEEKNRPIIEAVDAGLSYTQVAQKFGLKSRCVVAGIMNRRPEARGVTA